MKELTPEASSYLAIRARIDTVKLELRTATGEERKELQDELEELEERIQKYTVR